MGVGVRRPFSTDEAPVQGKNGVAEAPDDPPDTRTERRLGTAASVASPRGRAHRALLGTQATEAPPFSYHEATDRSPGPRTPSRLPRDHTAYAELDDLVRWRRTAIVMTIAIAMIENDRECSRARSCAALAYQPLKPVDRRCIHFPAHRLRSRILYSISFSMNVLSCSSSMKAARQSSLRRSISGVQGRRAVGVVRAGGRANVNVAAPMELGERDVYTVRVDCREWGRFDPWWGDDAGTRKRLTSARAHVSVRIVRPYP